jgi:predicted O-linked N-acetylglucosamine transferase (SPINDLY family)
MSKPKLIHEAIDLHSAGDLDRAAALYERILRSAPNHADALHLLGLIAYQRGDDVRAVELIGRAVAVKSGVVVPHNHLGMALLRLGRLEDAAACFGRALALDPRFALAHNNLGVVRQRQERLDDAIACYSQAVATDPKYSAAHKNLGQARRLKNEFASAAESFRAAIALNPDDADALAGLADTLLALGHAAEAVPVFQRALELAPDKESWHRSLGDALQTLGELPRAVVAYRNALERDDSYVEAWCGLGSTQTSMGEYAAAAKSLRRSVELARECGEAHHELGKALFDLGQVDEALAAFRRAAGLLSTPELPLGAIATIIPGSPTADNAAVREARRAWAVVAAPSVPAARPRPRPEPSGRPLRLGYVCAFFEDRNWMKPVWGLINNHDRARFAVHLFSDAPAARIRHGYRPHPDDRFYDTTGLSNADAARMIEDQQIDILVDLNGYSRLQRLPLFALRPAPVIVAWFNTFAPTGMGCYDYLIGDEHVIPAGEEEFYDERIVRVPGSYLTYEVTYPVPDVGSAPCLRRGAVTFGCLAPQYKITAAAVAAWGRILRDCPGTRLVLKSRFLGSPENRRYALDLFGRHDLPLESVELDGPAEHYTFLDKYNEIDIALDTFPYNGGTTTMESLWQGVPVLTFAGDRWVSRISASLMRTAGLPEYVAADLHGYMERAIELGRDKDLPARLAALRQTMRDRLRHSRVCDCRAFARDMEREYLRMSNRRCGE